MGYLRCYEAVCGRIEIPDAGLMIGTKGGGFTKRLGVIGGLGPIATAYFYELMIQMTDARIDQEHIEILIFSKPSIPDRTAYILGKSNDNPVHAMIDIGRLLVAMGADYIAIPCITAHYFHDTLTEGINAPIIHIIKETTQYLNDRGVRRAGIMATEGTVFSGLFQEELRNCGIEPIIPSPERQKDVTDLIYKNVKANLPPEMDKFQTVSTWLRENGSEVIILGCTELSLIKRDYDIGPGYIDAMEVLAMRSIQLCEAKLKEEFISLITK
jgi:aspartate racemase